MLGGVSGITGEEVLPDELLLGGLLEDCVEEEVDCLEEEVDCVEEEVDCIEELLDGVSHGCAEEQLSDGVPDMGVQVTRGSRGVAGST